VFWIEVDAKSLQRWQRDGKSLDSIAENTMNAQQQIQAAIGVGLLLATSGCASIISGRHADVTFYSNVPGAHVVVHDKHGREVASALTPSTIALKRKDRIIFPARYTATIEAPGYQTVQVPIGSKVNPWVFGNAIFLYGGLVGLAIDNATGAAWAPRESTIYQELTPTSYANQGAPRPAVQTARASAAQTVQPTSGVY
jgi:hypothetical protein